MFTYEFSAIVTEDGAIAIPTDYASHLPKGEPVRIVVFVDDQAMQKHETSDTQEAKKALEELVARIKSRPSDLATIKPGNMVQLAENLSYPLPTSDPDFDEVAWNQQWSQIETEMDTLEQAKSAQRLQEMLKTMNLP